MKKVSGDDALMTKLSRMYRITLVILATVLILSLLFTQYALHASDSDTRVMNIAGRQRMLSQEISKAALGMYGSLEAESREYYLNELKSSLELWKASQYGLQYGDNELGRLGTNSDRIVGLFKLIEPHYDAMVKAAGDLTIPVSSDDAHSDRIRTSLQTLLAHEPDFLDGMDAIVFQYEAESSAKIEWIKWINILFLLIGLAVIGLEIHFIFRPVVRFVEQTLQEATARNKAISREEEMEREMEAFLDVNLDMLCVSDMEGNFIKVNKRFEEILGHSVQDLEGKAYLSLVHEDDVQSTIAAGSQLKNHRNVESFTNRYRCKDGSYRFIEWHAQPGAGKQVYASGRDITEKIQSEELLKNLAIRDELTGMYNRHYLDSVMDNHMENADRYDEPLSMLMFDLDRFKQVNDTWGHPVGDDLLKMTSRIIKENLRDSDLLFRLGGEEFLVLLPKTPADGGGRVAEKIRLAIEAAEHPVTGHRTTSVGVSQRMKAESFRHWFRRTDEALYRAKEEGRNRVVRSDGYELLPLASEHLEWKQDWESGDKEIDGQHQTIRELINELVVMLLEGESDQEWIVLLDRLLGHIHSHFEYEEGKLLQVGFPDREKHIGMHVHLAGKATWLREALMKGEVSPSAFISFLLDDVILGHLEKMDALYFPFLRI